MKKVSGSAVADSVRVSVPGGWWGIAAFFAACLLATCPGVDSDRAPNGRLYQRIGECQQIEDSCLTYPLFCDDAEFAKCIAEEAEARRQQEFESLTPAQRSAEIRGQERTRRLLERQSERDREQARERLERYLRERDNSR